MPRSGSTITYSAGTYTSKICIVCESPEGQTAEQMEQTPHPIYTNASGDAVVQLQMVEIGGFNGVNN